MTLFCDYCRRVCDDRCELCKYKAEAIELNEEDKDNEKDQANNS